MTTIQNSHDARQPSPEEIARHVANGRRLRSYYIANGSKQFVAWLHRGFERAEHRLTAAVRRAGHYRA